MNLIEFDKVNIPIHLIGKILENFSRIILSMV